MQKVKDKIVPIKVKLLTIIIPAVIIAMIVLIGISYSISKDLILDYSSSLLNSSIENQANEIESWLNENLAAFQMAKNVIETTSPDDEELQKYWMVIMEQMITVPRDFMLQMKQER